MSLVLVVADELEARNRHTKVLRDAGFEVFTATTLKEAQEFFAAHGDQINAVIVGDRVSGSEDNALDLIVWLSFDMNYRGLMMAASNSTSARQHLKNTGCSHSDEVRRAAARVVELLNRPS